MKVFSKNTICPKCGSSDAAYEYLPRMENLIYYSVILRTCSCLFSWEELPLDSPYRDVAAETLNILIPSSSLVKSDSKESL